MLQADGELTSLKVGRVPVVTAGGSQVFLPLSREDQVGQMNSRLPVIILEPSGLVHTPLLTGKTQTDTMLAFTHPVYTMCVRIHHMLHAHAYMQ